MSKLPVLMIMPHLTLSNSRPILSLFRISSIHSYTPLFSYPFSPFVENMNTFARKSNGYFSTLAVSAARTQNDANLRFPVSKKTRFESPESVFKARLDMCSRNNDLAEAVKLYKKARIDGISLSVYHYNILLYLCANSDSNDSLELGLEMFRQMGVDRIEPNEASFTSLARLASAKNDPEMAFDLVKRMKGWGVVPKLRSYGPVLFGFCEKGDADRAYEVDAHMVESGVVPEEDELATLLKVSVEAKRGDKVYEMLHRLRVCVRQVSVETGRIVESWFLSEASCGIGVENWDVDKVKEGVLRSGGWCHGQGWLGRGEWRVVKAEMNEMGVCSSCGEKLVCIDIDPKETEGFATSLSSLACQNENMTNFLHFQEWLMQHGPFDAVVDGANVSLIHSHSFNFWQLNQVVEQLKKISPTKKMPLIVLHKGRVSGGAAEGHYAKKLLENWRKAGVLYATPKGSNDDWYWLYAAVSNKCLLVTNDEMRDHLFQLLGDNIFPRWKEKHQVRMTPSRKGLVLHMPPPYSIVIQESEGGSWHVPTVIGDELETPRQWICATRASGMAKPRPQLSNLFLKR